MKRILLVSKEKSFDIEYLQNLLDLVSKENHPVGQACCSGDPLEFQIEETFVRNQEKDVKVLKLDLKTGKLVAVY
jgi:hypothetical protein